MQLSLLEVSLGSRWYDAYLSEDDGGGGGGGDSDDGFGFGGFVTPPRLRHAPPSFVEGRHLWWWQRPQQPPGGGGGSDGESGFLGAAAGLWPFGGGGARGAPSPARERGGGGAAGAQGGGAAARPPVFALARLRYGRHQRAESQPVRVSPNGRATFLESFVFTTKRWALSACSSRRGARPAARFAPLDTFAPHALHPTNARLTHTCPCLSKPRVAARPLKDKRVTLEVLLRGEGLPGGKLLARAEWSSIDLLMQSPPPPTTWLGVHAVRGAGRREREDAGRGEGRGAPLAPRGGGTPHAGPRPGACIRRARASGAAAARGAG